MMIRAIVMDLAGQKFNSWEVISFSHRNADHKAYWLCKCKCGREKTLDAYNLTSGRSKSCRPCSAKVVAATVHTTHGLSVNGRAPHPLYTTWTGMRSRCNNPNHSDYEYYGARGIKVCERWDDFLLFVEDMGARPIGKTLDRKDVNGDYEPSNCKWSTHSEQMFNRRSFVIKQKRRPNRPILILEDGTEIY